ncbi:alpha-L-fucosidase [Filimonas effusa]|uniref:alpha-L-fucosidase n=1 Tax=Filimonas effusa TaxID=2508721 RepID=A0A4Q1DBC4_9BACT|nr:alpha-L-fucosidase [Filimonas effusa]RXK86600.1 alpha-L-fucosidase [Filimonas effusa]
MKKILIVIGAIICCKAAHAQTYTPTAENLASRKVFSDMRFGMFIHWGLFSIPGAGEWVMHEKNITVKNYTRLQEAFNPAGFDAARYVAAAKSAGMKYITLVTRHHDGFSLWPTRYSDFNITHTPYKKDVVKQVADECHRQGIKLFFYYSLLDWRRDDYSYWTGNTGKGTGRIVRGNWNEYISFMKNQLTELLTLYGQVDGIWFDGYWDQYPKDTRQVRIDWHMREIYDLIHQLQPQCLVGNNHHLAPLPGEDFQMFEKDLPGANTSGFGGAQASVLPMETCETMNKSWGFNLTDTSYKSVKMLIHYLVNAAGADANFLLNIGPMPGGQIQPEFTDTLARIGAWMKKNGVTIYGTRGRVTPQQQWGTVTAKDRQLYIHILETGNHSVFVKGVNRPVRKAFVYGDGRPVKFMQQADGVLIELDHIPVNEMDLIIQLDF